MKINDWIQPKPRIDVARLEMLFIATKLIVINSKGCGLIKEITPDNNYCRVKWLKEKNDYGWWYAKIIFDQNFEISKINNILYKKV